MNEKNTEATLVVAGNEDQLNDFVADLRANADEANVQIKNVEFRQTEEDVASRAM